MYEFEQIQKASDWLREGNLLAYPTESVWGLGCDAMNQQAVMQILTIKQRPIAKGMIVVTDSLERIKPFLTSLTHQQQQLISHSWKPPKSDQFPKNQQAVTWLLPIPHDIHIPDWITGQHQSLAIRVINHPKVQQLCANLVSVDNPFGFLISSSCNPSSLQPACNLDDAKQYFLDHHNIGYLKGDTLGYNRPSQIKDVMTLDVIR